MSENQPRDDQPKKLLEMREEEKKPLLSANARKEIREWITSLLVAFVAVLIIRSFLFTIIRVDGPSMETTLMNNDRLFVTVADLKFGEPERFDVVICRYPGRREQFVKRLIGLPGDTIAVSGGVLYLNGEPVEEPFLAEDRTVRYRRGSYDFDPIEIPEGRYFVMGDHRDNSNDSRSVGLLTRDQFVGTVRCIIWPLNRIGSVAGSGEYNQ